MSDPIDLNFDEDELLGPATPSSESPKKLPEMGRIPKKTITVEDL